MGREETPICPVPRRQAAGVPSSQRYETLISMGEKTRVTVLSLKGFPTTWWCWGSRLWTHGSVEQDICAGGKTNRASGIFCLIRRKQVTLKTDEENLVRQPWSGESTVHEEDLSEEVWKPLLIHSEPEWPFWFVALQDRPMFLWEIQCNNQDPLPPFDVWLGFRPHSQS